MIFDFSYFTDCFDFSIGVNKLKLNIYFILYFIFEIASDLALYLSIFYFSPMVIMVSDIISPLFTYILNIIHSNIELIEIILLPIGYLIILFSTLIYTEFIILNCCNLNKNTKKFINKRINMELEEIKIPEKFIPSETENDGSLMTNDN